MKSGVSNALKDNILKGLPKTSKKNARLIIEQLKKHSDIIRWEANGDVYFKNSRIPNTKFTDLLTNSVTNRESLSIPVMAQSVFTKALSDANVADTWIKNKEQKRLLQTYKDLRNENPYSPVKLRREFSNDFDEDYSLPKMKRTKRWASST